MPNSDCPVIQSTAFVAALRTLLRQAVKAQPTFDKKCADILLETWHNQAIEEPADELSVADIAYVTYSTQKVVRETQCNPQKGIEQFVAAMAIVGGITVEDDRIQEELATARQLVEQMQAGMGG